MPPSSERTARLSRAQWHDIVIFHMTSEPIKSIVICGAGLASWLTAAALSKQLPSSIEITVLDTSNSNRADVIYGSITNPATYNFHSMIGLTEADLLMRTRSSFSYGTHYKNWGLTGATWTQCFHGPFPIWNGVPFAHHIIGATQNFEGYLVSTQAAIAGKFAHPPSDKNVALSSAEYGYHIQANDLTYLMKMIASKNGVQTVSRDIVSIKHRQGKIETLNLTQGESLSGDLFIDASGPQAQLISSFEKDSFQSNRRLAALSSEQESSRIGAPVRQLNSEGFGWQSITPLQGVDTILTVFDPESEEEARKSHSDEKPIHVEFSTGERRDAWRGNCIAIGQAAAVIEPISPAPLMLLQMDIQRLLGLIPVAEDFSVETRIFNDAFQLDLENIRLFNNAFYQIENIAKTPYWTAAKLGSSSAKLTRKLRQFSNRGLLVNYDLEPFNAEDWTILHYGIGRQPKKKDLFAELSDKSEIGQKLEHMANAIQTIIHKMPPHHIYMANYLNYLERNHVSEL